jgi:hypothetical protein
MQDEAELRDWSTYVVKGGVSEVSRGRSLLNLAHAARTVNVEHEGAMRFCLMELNIIPLSCLLVMVKISSISRAIIPALEPSHNPHSSSPRGWQHVCLAGTCNRRFLALPSPPPPIKPSSSPLGPTFLLHPRTVSSTSPRNSTAQYHYQPTRESLCFMRGSDPGKGAVR